MPVTYKQRIEFYPSNRVDQLVRGGSYMRGLSASAYCNAVLLDHFNAMPPQQQELYLSEAKKIKDKK